MRGCRNFVRAVSLLIEGLQVGKGALNKKTSSSKPSHFGYVEENSNFEAKVQKCFSADSFYSAKPILHSRAGRAGGDTARLSCLRLAGTSISDYVRIRCKLFT